MGTTSEGQLLELKPSPVMENIGLSPSGGGRRGYAMDGLAGEPELSLRSFSPIFIVYQQNIDIGSFRLSDLVYVETERAGSFNIIRTDPRFFRNVYGRDMNDVIQINLWRPKTEVPLRLEPVEGKVGMHRLIPQSPLRPGRYALYIKGDLHLYNMVHATDSSRKYSAFYFEVSEGVRSDQLNPTHTEEKDKCAQIECVPPINLSGAAQMLSKKKCEEYLRKKCLEELKDQ